MCLPNVHELDAQYHDTEVMEPLRGSLFMQAQNIELTRLGLFLNKWTIKGQSVSCFLSSSFTI